MLRAAFLAAAVLLLPQAASAESAEELIAREIAARYASDIPRGDVVVRLPVSVSREPESLDAISWDPASSRFVAVLVFDGKRVRMSGNARAEVEVPVVTRTIQPGEVIRDADVSMIRVAAVRSLESVASAKEEVVGKEARKSISAGRVIPSESVADPSVIRRNRTVTMVYRDGAMTLTSRGKALGDAKVGEDVRIAPPGGGQPVVGVAMEDGTVKVRRP